MLMAGQAFASLIARGELVGSAVLVVIGVALIVLAPAKQSGERVSPAVFLACTLERRHPDIPILKEAKAEYAKLQ
jgi:hypothetical protein